VTEAHLTDRRPPAPRAGARAKRRASIAVACLLAAAAIVVTAVHFSQPKDAGLPAVGSVIPVAQRPTAPGIQGTTLTGQHLNVASLRGAPVVLNFWGSWCAPCQAEAPVLAQVARQTGSRAHFVGVDTEDTTSNALAFESAHGVRYPSIADPSDRIAASFGADAPDTTPSTYILDARGRIAWAWFSTVTARQLESALAKVGG